MLTVLAGIGCGVSEAHGLGVVPVTSSPLLPPDGPHRYQSTVPSRRDAWSNIALRVAFTTLASAGSAWLFCVVGGGGLPGLVFGMTVGALAGGAALPGIVGPDQARPMLALADVLAESPDRSATRQAVADLRMLATAPPGRVRQWMGT